MFLDDGVGLRLTRPPAAQGKSAGDGDDPDFPLSAGGLLQRKRRFRARRFLQHAPEAAEQAADVTNALPGRSARCSKYVTGLERLSGRAETGLPLPSPHLTRTGQQP